MSLAGQTAGASVRVPDASSQAGADRVVVGVPVESYVCQRPQSRGDRPAEHDAAPEPETVARPAFRFTD